MSELAKLEIDVPPLDMQQTIIELNRLRIKADEIEVRIHQKRSLLMETIVRRFSSFGMSNNYENDSKASKA